jgi:hypothetical protein
MHSAQHRRASVKRRGEELEELNPEPLKLKA